MPVYCVGVFALTIESIAFQQNKVGIAKKRNGTIKMIIEKFQMDDGNRHKEAGMIFI